MKIEPIFPSALGVSMNDNHNSMKEKPLQYCLDKLNDIEKGGDNWSSKVYNTCGTKNLITIPEFGNLNDWVFQEVVNYVTELGFKNIKLQPYDSWFNVYKKYDFQEFHCHPNRQLSVIYVLKSTKENPKIIFERNEGLYTEEFDVDTKALSTKVRYSSIQGNLLIFRSSLHHCVEMKQDNSERISLAYNFNLKKP